MARDPDKMARTPVPASEHHWGPGMHPNPRINYEGRVDPKAAALNGAARPRSLDQQILDLQAYRRLDSTRVGETLEDMYTAAGNTDRFGPNPPLVNRHAKMTKPEKRNTESDWRMEREW